MYPIILLMSLQKAWWLDVGGFRLLPSDSHKSCNEMYRMIGYRNVTAITTKGLFQYKDGVLPVQEFPLKEKD